MEPAVDPVREKYGTYTHIFLSPACYHEKHRNCRQVCHSCESRCICDCHLRKGK